MKEKLEVRARTCSLLNPRTSSRCWRHILLQRLRDKAESKLEKASLLMREQDDDFNAQRHEFQREITHLRSLLREREAMMEALVMDKK